MTFAGSDRKHALIWGATGIALLILLWLLSPILPPFLLGAVFAYICDPAVNWLVARRLSRPVAASIVILVAGLVMLIVAFTLIPMLYREGVALIRRLPDLFVLFNTHVAPQLQEWFDTDSQIDVEQFRALISEHWDRAQDLIPVVLQHIRTSGNAVISIAVNLFMIPLIMFYLLKEWPRLLAGLNQIIPRPFIAQTNRILKEMDLVLSEFLRGQLSVMLLLAIFYSVGLWLAGLKFALPVGIATGLMSFIPFFGFGGGVLLAVVAALLQTGDGSPLIGVAIVYTLGQVLETVYLTPYLVGERIGLHPLAVLFALMAFGQLFGFVGVLLALPASAAVLVGLREMRLAWFNSPIYLGKTDNPDKTSTSS